MPLPCHKFRGNALSDRDKWWPNLGQAYYHQARFFRSGRAEFGHCCLKSECDLRTQLTDRSRDGRVRNRAAGAAFRGQALLERQRPFPERQQPARPAYAYVLRSPHAHARIRRLDLTAAKAAPGVAADHDRRRSRRGRARRHGRAVPAQAAGRVADVRPRPSRPRAGHGALRRRAGRLRRRRDAGAGEGRRRADRRSITTTLPSVTDTAEAAEGKIAVWPECPDNISNLFEAGNKAAADAAFVKAAHIVKRRYIISRVYAHFMEPRGAIGVWDPGEERFTLYADVQYPHRVRQALATRIFKIPESKIRVIAGDVGGGFGTKGWQYPEHRLVLLAAKKVAPAGQMDLRAQRGDPGRRARPRQCQRRRTGARQRRQVPRPPGQDLRQCRRLYLVRAQPARDLRQCRHLDRRLRHPGGLCRGLGGDGQHQRHRALSRRRPARGDLCHRAADRRRGARTGLRPRRTAPQEHDPARPAALSRPRSASITIAAISPPTRRRRWRRPIGQGFAARRDEAKARGKLRGIGIANPIEKAAGTRPGIRRDPLSPERQRDPA